MKKFKKKDRWNHCHHFPILALLEANYHPHLLHKDKSFLWVSEKDEHIKDFAIGYMTNPTLNVNISFK